MPTLPRRRPRPGNYRDLAGSPRIRRSRRRRPGRGRRATVHTATSRTKAAGLVSQNHRNAPCPDAQSRQAIAAGTGQGEQFPAFSWTQASPFYEPEGGSRCCRRGCRCRPGTGRWGTLMGCGCAAAGQTDSRSQAEAGREQQPGKTCHTANPGHRRPPGRSSSIRTRAEAGRHSPGRRFC